MLYLSDTNLFYNYLISYSIFFKYDLHYSLIEGRDFTKIDFFRKILQHFFNKKNTKKQIQESLRELRAYLNPSKKTSINIKFNFNHHHFKINNKSLKELEFYFLEFFVAYEFLVLIEQRNEKINNILVEFNNSLAHILFALENNNNFLMKININKAKSHLYRGTLDCYKEILLANPSIIKKNYNLYLKIRAKEALNMGKSEDIKKILVEKYKLLIQK